MGRGSMSADPHAEVRTRRRLRPLLVLVASLFASWTLWATLLLPRLSPVDGIAQHVRSVGVRLLLWVLPSAVYLWHQYGKRALDPLQLGPPPSARHWAVSAALTVAASLAVSVDVARKLGVAPVTVWHRLVANYEFHFPTAPLFEELIFRGVIFSELITLLGVRSWTDSASLPARGRFWLANVMASVVFTGLHWPWWVYTHGLGDPRVYVQSAGVFLISIVLGILFVRGRSVWPCVVLHWLNNELSVLAS